MGWVRGWHGGEGKGVPVADAIENEARWRGRHNTIAHYFSPMTAAASHLGI